MALTRQCALAGITRSTIYATHLVDEPNELELLLLALIDAEYMLHPFYGSRMPGLELSLTEYFYFYNTERPHQSLGNLTPVQVYQTAIGGGASIVDKFKERKPFLEVGAKSKAETTTLN